MIAPDLDILDDLFHGDAFAAFVEQAALNDGPPEMEAILMRLCVNPYAFWKTAETGIFSHDLLFHNRTSVSIVV